MRIDKGLNDRWVRPPALRRTRRGAYALTLREPLGQAWPAEIVFYELPADLRRQNIAVTLQGQPVPAQRDGSRLAILVEDLQPQEERRYEVRTAGGTFATGSTTPTPSPSGGGELPQGSPPPEGAGVGSRSGDPRPGAVQFTRRRAHVELSNGLIALKLPASQRPRNGAVPGPVIAVRRGQGAWLGRGRLETTQRVHRITTRLAQRGPLWSTAEVQYTVAGGHTYRVNIRLRPGDGACEVFEESSLPVRLWPAPRPYREIGTLAKSHWDQPLEAVARPCTRPCPTSNFILEVDADRMITHSTASWEMMDMPLHRAAVKTYTAMRPALPGIDACWLGVYHRRQQDWFGVAAVDTAHWKAPDDVVHPAHRTPGASGEVLLVDGPNGPHFRFPIENLTRRWLLAVGSRKDSPAFVPRRQAGQPLRLEADPSFPLWALHTRRGDLRLDKVKDWIVDWPDAGAAHPRVLCRRADFPAIRRKVKAIPEFRRNRAKYRPWRGADEYLLTGRKCGLKQVEAQTHAGELIAGILARGYVGPTYCIGLARPLRRYVLTCDILWDSFTREEKRAARRVCALAAYILSDGDFWQFAYRPNETTYLPNFNTDEYTCTGLLGLFLSDHPCSQEWVNFCVKRLDVELPMYLRRDGGGEENIGGYLMSTWTQLYLPAFWALRHGRIRDYSRDPNVLGGARFLTKVCGPPDPREDGKRFGFPIGHHPHAKKAFPLYSQLAAFLRRSDPATASRLMWMWRQCGAPVGNLHDHSGPTANLFTRHYLMHDPSLPERPPALGSYNLPHVGAVLRSHGASGKGSCLFLKAGRVHSHHDEDEGSFHYFGRGVPLALDGLPIQNGATRDEHNQVSFGRYGQPTGIVERFRTTPAADYVRAVIAPRAFCCDANFVDDSHRSGWTRELVLVKAEKPGGVEYLVVKDTCTGPDPARWNLDVLSRRPQRASGGRIWFPGHREFDMGLDVLIAEPSCPNIVIEKGKVNPDLLSARRRRRLLDHLVKWTTVEHWLLHLPAGPGTTFAVVLFPRRPTEPVPELEYLVREETLSIRHAEGCDLIFLRPNPMVGTNLDGVEFRGRAGVLRERHGQRVVQALDAAEMRLVDYPDRSYQLL